MALSIEIIEVKIKRKCHACEATIGKGHHVVQLTTGWGANAYKVNMCPNCLSKLNGEMSNREEGKIVDGNTH